MTRLFTATVLCVALVLPLAAQQTSPRTTLEVSPTLFAVMASINVCGYDQDLSASLPLRSQIRSEVMQAAHTPAAQQALENMCRFYADHQQPESSHQLAQYVSLALNMGDAPEFELKVKEADLPPDAVHVMGFAPLVREFYATAGLAKVWQRHAADYNQLVEQYSTPVRNLLTSTDVYLKQPLSSYSARSFVVYLEPLAAPALVNSRNYGDDYFMVISPSPSGIRLEQVRHTYLHFAADPLAQSHGTSMQRLLPLLQAVKNAPLEDSFKKDVSLLVTESLIRAVEAHLVGGRKGPENDKLASVKKSMREGYILTQYFYAALTRFEQAPESLANSYGIWLLDIDPSRELKRASEIEFAKNSEPEVVRRDQRRQPLLNLAERALSSGNLDGAERFAKQAMNGGEDTGRALFILARVATMNRQVDNAQQYFERALQATKDDTIRSWSHIYLGRIFDLREERAAAVTHYQAALGDGNVGPEIRKAAERGIKEPYVSPVKHPANK